MIDKKFKADYFATSLRRAMLAKGHTVRSLAQALDVSPSTIQWMRTKGTANIGNVLAVCFYFQFDPYDFI